ncbi:MAG: TonB-dependent receptor [Bacteroidales bacterium]|nr:TonB-dependent receptor [Bacteroidales bacterium]
MNRLLKLCFLISWMLPVQLIVAQTGSVSGIIQDKKTRETLIGANIIVKGTTLGVSTDIDGKFKLQGLDSGAYTLEVSYISYKPLTLDNVKVAAGKNTDLVIMLEEDAQLLDGVTVSERKKTDTEVSMISSIKVSNVAVTGITSEQIARSLDKDAAEVIRRVPGVTIIDDRFVVVRGLMDRYNTVWLNRSSTPSSEADKKSFSFDVIPSASLDRMMIYKTPAPELPADFAGAAIQLYTKNLPEKNSVTVGYKAGYRPETTFRDFYMYEGGKTDWLGFDDGTRSLPDGFPGTDDIEEWHDWADLGLPAEEMQAILANKRANLEKWGRSFNKIWSGSRKTAPTDHALDIEFHRRFKLRNLEAGNITSIIYRNDHNSYEVDLARYRINENLGIIDTNFTYTDNVYDNSVTVGILHNWSFLLKNGMLLEFRNLLNQIGRSVYTERNGFDFYRERFVRSYELGYMNRTTYSGQLAGKYEFNEDSGIDWVLGFAYANRKDPDVRRVYTVRNQDSDTSGVFYGQYEAQFNPDANPELNGRLFLDLEERIWNAGANFRKKVYIGDFTPEIKTGIYTEVKNRDFNARNIGFVVGKSSEFNDTLKFIKPIDSIYSNANINYPYGILLDEKTNATDSYKGENQLVAGYIGLLLPFSARLNLYTGVRAEWNKQRLSGFYDNPEADSLDVIIDTLNFFPSANLTWDLSEKTQIRASYGLTINRPEFREIAPFSYYDFITQAQVYGNDTSLSNGYIHNYDLRLEWYPSFGEMVTIGAFYKMFIDPIENTLIPGSTEKWTFQPANAVESRNYGLEVDIRKTFAFLDNSNTFFRNFRHFTLIFNAAYIQSEVQEKKQYIRDDKRPMQGQSPYIINTGLYYDNRSKGFMASVLFNVIGERIIFVGVEEPHTYELPRNLLEFAFTKQLGEHFKIKGGIEDILNEPVKLIQTVNYEIDTDEDGINDKSIEKELVMRSFRPGSKFSLGVSYTF